MDAEVTDRERRSLVFAGNLFVYSPRPSTLVLSVASRMTIESVLGPDPVRAQQQLTEAEFAAKFRVAARSFSDNAVELACATVTDFGCDPDETFVGVPLLVATTGRNFFAYGFGAPHHPHRDTWYAAAPCQVNWWIPLYGLDASAAFAFHSSYWDAPVHNTSRDFDYEAWYAARLSGREITTTEAMAQPRPLDPIELAPDIRISCPAGGVIISSAAQLYSAVPNQTSETHFSVHFQTASAFDLRNGEGAMNLDAEPSGTALVNFVRCSDRSPMPGELAAGRWGIGAPAPLAQPPPDRI